MKKQIGILIFLILIAAGLAAETGYKGTDWGDSEDWIIRAEGRAPDYEEDYGEFNFYIYEKILLGEKTNLFYAIHNKYSLLTVFYNTSEKNNPKLHRLIGNMRKLHSVPFTQDIPWLTEEFKENSERTQECVNGVMLTLAVADIEQNYKYELPETEGNGNLSIYDYNEDTRLYIFENVIPEKTIVVYYPHYEDEF